MTMVKKSVKQVNHTKIQMAFIVPDWLDEALYVLQGCVTKHTCTHGLLSSWHSMNSTGQRQS